MALVQVESQSFERRDDSRFEGVIALFALLPIQTEHGEEELDQSTVFVLHLPFLRWSVVPVVPQDSNFPLASFFELF